MPPKVKSKKDGSIDADISRLRLRLEKMSLGADGPEPAGGAGGPSSLPSSSLRAARDRLAPRYDINTGRGGEGCTQQTFFPCWMIDGLTIETFAQGSNMQDQRQIVIDMWKYMKELIMEKMLKRIHVEDALLWDNSRGLRSEEQRGACYVLKEPEEWGLTSEEVRSMLRFTHFHMDGDEQDPLTGEVRKGWSVEECSAPPFEEGMLLTRSVHALNRHHLALPLD